MQLEEGISVEGQLPAFQLARSGIPCGEIQLNMSVRCQCGVPVWEGGHDYEEPSEQV